MQRLPFLLKSEVFFVILVILISLPAAVPTLRGDFFSIHDETHMVDLYEMFRILSTQGFPPRWVPDVNFGLGHPYFNFYYHLPFYITSVFMFLGFSMIQAFKNYLLTSIIFAVVGFYFFAREYFSKPASILAATLYLYTPYFAVDLYVRGAVGELAILAILPWATFSMTRLIKKVTLPRFILTSIIFALLGIAHNVLNIFIFPMLTSYGLLLATGKDFQKKAFIFILAIIFGLGLSTYYILPALVEREYISIYEQIKIEDHFPFIKQLIIPHWGYSISHWGPDDDLSFQIGIVNLIALILAVIFIFKVKTDEQVLSFGNRSLAIFFTAVFAAACILMNSRTLPFWNLHPVLRSFQFPWRLLIFTTFATSFMFGFATQNILAKFDKKRVILYGALGIFCTMTLTVWYFKPSEYKQIRDERYLELYFANRTLKGNGERGNLSLEYLNFSEDFVPPTKWAFKRPKDIPKNLIEPKNNALLSVTKQGINYQIEITTKDENFLKIYTSSFPGWSAKTDGQNTPIFPTTDLGIIGLNVPAGKHILELTFANTSIRTFANLVSLMFAIALTMLIAKSFLDVKIKK